MRVRVNRTLNRRLWPALNNTPLPDPLQPNDIVSVVELVQGEAIEPGNTTWYRTDENFLVYSGGTSEVTDDLQSYWAHDKLQIPRLRREFSEFGDGVRVAVLDSGVTPSDDLAGRIIFHDALGLSKAAVDEDGHGTSCCGVVGGSRFGLAPQAIVVAVRVMQKIDSVNSRDIAAGIRWVIQQGNIDVISLSICMLEEEQVLTDAINDAIQQKITVVAAAGNINKVIDLYPAALKPVFSVGAVDSQLKKVLKSASSKQLDVVAPGVEIKTTNAGLSRGVFGGTSAAAAYAAGCITLFRAHMKRKNLSVTPEKLPERIKASARPFTNKPFDIATGAGLMRPYETIKSLK